MFVLAPNAVLQSQGGTVVAGLRIAISQVKETRTPEKWVSPASLFHLQPKNTIQGENRRPVTRAIRMALLDKGLMGAITQFRIILESGDFRDNRRWLREPPQKWQVSLSACFCFFSYSRYNHIEPLDFVLFVRCHLARSKGEAKRDRARDFLWSLTSQGGTISTCRLALQCVGGGCFLDLQGQSKWKDNLVPNCTARDSTSLRAPSAIRWQPSRTRR